MARTRKLAIAEERQGLVLQNDTSLLQALDAGMLAGGPEGAGLQPLGPLPAE